MKTKYEILLTQFLEYNEETEYLEFKEDFDNPIELGEYISALSNAACICEKDFAYLIWGVSDNDHKIIGTSFNYRKVIKQSNEELEHFLARQLTPSLNFKFIEVTHQNKRIVMLEIPKARNVPTSFAGNRFIRIGSSKENLRRYPNREVILFESLKEPSTIVDVPSLYQKLTFEKLLGYYNAKGIILNRDNFKESMHLKTSNGEYNILAQLLADENHIEVRLSTFDGYEKSDRMIGLKEFGNTCILVALDSLLQYSFIINEMQTSDNGKIPRVDTPYFNQEAFNEAAINAFVHNKWIEGDAPQFHIYKDRIEIISHGGIPKNQTKEKLLQGISKPVNRQLAEIFLQLRISERTGRGVPRIVKAYGENAFYFGDGFIKVTIPFSIVNREQKLGKRVIADTIKISSTKKKILKAMHNNSSISINELKEIVGISFSGINKNIIELRQKGIIERIGPDRGGSWKVNYNLDSI